MLSTAFPILQNSIKMILSSPEVAKVFEDAYMQTLPLADLDDMDDDMAKQEIKNQMQNTAEMFGKMCAFGLDKAVTQKLATAIDTYVKSISITATPTALISPIGPVAGVMPPTDFQVL